jgi:hypothetical protein
MIRTDAPSLFAEVQASERLRDSVLKASREIRDVYVSQYYRDDMKPQPSPMNFPHEFIATVTPAIVFDNPQVQVTSSASGVDGKILKMMEFALNQWAKVDTLWQDLHLTWIDVVFSYGVIHTYLEPRQSMSGEDFFKVCAKRVDPACFLMDSRATNWTTAKWQGHAMTRDKSELAENPAYFKEVIEKLPTDSDLGKAGVSAKDQLTRDEVVIYEVWIPDVKLPPGFDPKTYHGMIYELSSEGVFVREPRPFFGPAWGPYTFFGLYVVPNQPYPLGPIGAIWDQVVEYNKHAVGAAKSAARNKNIVVVDSRASASGETIRTASDGDVVTIDGLGDNLIREMKLGGAMDSQSAYLDRLQARLDRSTGLSDAARGVNSGKGTATEAADAASQRDARTDYMAKQFTQGTESVLYTAAWYMWHSSFVQMKLSPEAALELNPRPKMLPSEDEAEKIAYSRNMSVDDVRSQLKWEPQAEFRGGESLHGNEHDFDDMMLKIEPFSMERTNEPLLQRRMTEFVGLLMKLAPVMPQNPHIRWDKVLEAYGDVFNRRNISEFIQGDVLREAQQAAAAKAQQEQMMIQQQQAQAQAQQQGAQIAQAPLGGAQPELAGMLTGQAQDAAQGVA